MTRARFARLGIITGVGIGVLVGFSALLAPPSFWAERLAARLSDQLGAQVTIAGAARPRLWPRPQIRVTDLALAPAEASGALPAVSVDRAQVSWTWGGVLSRGGAPQSMRLEGVELRITHAGVSDAGATPTEFHDWVGSLAGLEAVEIASGRIRIARANQPPLDIRQVSGRLEMPSSAQTAAITGTGRVAGTRYEFSALTTDRTALISGGAPPIRVDLLWPDGTASFEGAADLAGMAEGLFALRSENPAPFAGLFGLRLPPDLPQGLGRERMVVDGQLQRSGPGQWHLRAARVELDQNTADVALDLSPGSERPLIRGTIAAESFAVPSLPPVRDASGWSEASLDVSGLFLADAELTLRTDRLSLGPVTASAMDLRLTLTRGRAVFDIQAPTIAGGQLGGQSVVNGRGGLSMGGELVLSNARFSAPDTQSGLGMSGRGSAALEFLAVGDSVAELVAGLEARADFAFWEGTLGGLATGPSEAEPTLGFERLSGDLTVTEGVAEWSEVELLTPTGFGLASGRLDLNSAEVALQIEGLEQIILLDGPIAAPTLRWRAPLPPVQPPVPPPGVSPGEAPPSAPLGPRYSTQALSAGPVQIFLPRLPLTTRP